MLHDPVTTTDELIPSGETSSYRSNPMKLASFTLSRREPQYVPRTAEIRAAEQARAEGKPGEDVLAVCRALDISEQLLGEARIGSALYAERPGDGSAREQAASCQRVLGGCANLCRAYATKRYRSNCINWGILPFTIEEDFTGEPGDWLWLPDVRDAVTRGDEKIDAVLVTKDGKKPVRLTLAGLTDEERAILLDGCLMNRYATRGE